MDLRVWVCFKLSRMFLRPAQAFSVDYLAYEHWRSESLGNTWQAFDDSYIINRDVLDFGCGDGQLSLFLARAKHPHRIVGADIDGDAIMRAKKAMLDGNIPSDVSIEFVRGTPTTMPAPDRSFDTVLAFDCMEHIMSPMDILREWGRVLRPGGRCLIEWVPYKGPWGPHMESLIPIPWAHVLFGERAVFRAAEMIYDTSEFQPRHWDRDPDGHKKPNKWRAWSSFSEQGYINKLDITTFRKMVSMAKFRISRMEKYSFSGSQVRKLLGKMFVSVPYVGKYFVSYYLIELELLEEARAR